MRTFTDDEERNILAARLLINLANRLMQGDVDCWEFPEITRGIAPIETVRSGLVRYEYDGTETLRITVKQRR